MIDKIPDWSSLDNFERSVALFAHNCAERIKSLQHPLMRALIPPPIVLDRSERGAFQRELIFPARSVFLSDDRHLDTMNFILFVDPQKPHERELHCTHFHAEDDGCCFENPTSSFGLTLTGDMMEWVQGAGRVIPSRKMISEIVIPDESEVALDIEDWFDWCLHLAAARPTRMPRPPIMDKVERKAPG